MKRFALIVCLLFTFTFQISANIYKKYDVRSGLSGNCVRSILQDSIGYMWFATQDGLNRFNGIEFTNRFSNSKRNLQTRFERTAAELGIRHKLIRPYTPRHNGKVERSHREDQKRFYSCHSFYSLEDFAKQLVIHNRRSNNFPMRPLRWLSPFEFAVQYV